MSRGTWRALATVGFAVALVAGAACSTTNNPITTPQDGATSDAPLPPVDSGPDTTRPPPRDASFDSAVPLSGRIDRAGRPLVARTLVSAGNRDFYNTLATHLPDAGGAIAFDGGTSLGHDFQAALVTLDLVDGIAQWDGGAADAGRAGPYAHPLVGRLLLDVLYVDTSMPFSPSGYLDIETEATPGAHATCGGRWMNDDALDKMVSWMVLAQTTGLSDGVSAPTKPASPSFPYLAPPN